MQAGKLRHRVTIEQQTAGSPQQKASGEPDLAWTTYITCWGSVEPLRGRELFAAQEHHSDVAVRVKIRGSASRRAGVGPQMRVSFNGRYYNILAILDRAERNVELELLCDEGTNLG